MSKLNATDIQGFVLRGYNLPVARYLFLRLNDARSARALVNQMLPRITTGQKWDGGKPETTLNIAFTYRGLMAFDLPLATLVSFPVEFQLGMKARADILGDTGLNAPEKWDPFWLSGDVHAWVAVNAKSMASLESACADLTALLAATGTTVVGAQDAASAVVERQAHNQGALWLYRRIWQPRLPWGGAEHTAWTGQAHARWPLGSAGNG